jgi:AmiR/NasT family two-component response regulator
MKRLRVIEEQAFRRLRKMANDQNRKMVEVAQTIVNAEDVFRQLEKG